MIKSKPHRYCNAIILLGSNIGRREQYLSRAWITMQLVGIEITDWSSIYETKAWGNTNQSDFLNQTLRIKTTLSPLELLYELQRVEDKLGRKRKVKWGPRKIDIDILYYENLALSVEELTIPHPAIAQRKFTLVPLTEIAPNYIHPKYKISNRNLLEKFVE